MNVLTSAQRVLTAGAIIAAVVGCSSSGRIDATDPCAKHRSVTAQTLCRHVGDNINDVIAERSVYPDSTDTLPNGNVVYRFTHGAGGRVFPNGYVQSRVCRVWLETTAEGVIVRWRQENCE